MKTLKNELEINLFFCIYFVYSVLHFLQNFDLPKNYVLKHN